MQALFWAQAAACEYAIRPGPGRLLSWGVKEDARDPANGRLVHDDLLVSAAMCAVFDEVTFGKAVSEVIQPKYLIEDRRIF